MISNISEPRYANGEKTLIDITVDIDGVGEGLPHTVGSDDSLFARLEAGEFGAVADYAAPAITPETLIAYANAKQWALATGGYTATIDGSAVLFQTTETAMSLIAGKTQRFAQPNPPASVDWQVGPTSFVTISASDFTAAATEIADFIQATFDALKIVLAGIVGGTIVSAADIDGASWPSAHD